MNKIHSIVIEKIVNGGLGLGRLNDGRIVLVEKALPNEKVLITVAERKSHYLRAEVASVETPHPARIEPPCPWYRQCGGCDLQHCSYEHQLLLKTAIVEELFHHHFPATAAGSLPPVRATLASPARFGYRQRIRLQVDPQGRPGFAGRHSHTVIPIDSCLVARDELNTVLAKLQQDCSLATILKRCRQVELLFDPLSARVVCLFHLIRRPRPTDIRLAEELAAGVALIKGVFFQGSDFPLTGPIGDGGNPCTDTLHMRLPPLSEKGFAITLGWEAGGFCQVNLGQNENLIRHILALCDLHGRESVLDLFCGMGNFSIPLAGRAGFLTGIEGQGSAIRSAARNSTAAGLDNTRFEREPVHAACRRLAGEKRIYDCVILDPPRQGVPGLAQELGALTGRKMVYISCDPATLCRDLKALCRQGLAIVDIRPFDMFPQTHHIETVVLLEKN